MKKLSIQKLSILGLVLMGASAVTAAVLPSNKKDASKFDAAGSITATSETGKVGSCTATASIQTPCNDTISRGAVVNSGSTANLDALTISNNTTAAD